MASRIAELLRLRTVEQQKWKISVFRKVEWRRLLSEYYPLLGILIGVVLVSASISPFHNIDTDLEYETAQGIIRWGMPYWPTFGKMINQPPLGFYVEALFLKIFGLSFETGVALITLFGLGCTFLVYAVGEVFYGKRTGLLAAALFAFTPWQLVLSRSFLIDVQCLFFSLFYLFVGIHAIRKDSAKLFVVSGTLFAAAFLTKFYAAFSLIPLMLLYIHYRPKKLRRAFAWAGAFFLPVLLFAFLWYQVISGQGLLSVFRHEDLEYYNSSVPSHFFVGNFLLEGLGWMFLAAVALSLLICFWQRKLFSKILGFDLICSATIVAMVSVNTYLGAGLNLSSPYLNPIKYVYQSLPFFSLLAASLGGKCVSLYKSATSKRKQNRLIFFSVAFVGLFLVITAIFANMNYAHQFSTWPYILFRVEMDKAVGYSFVNPAPTGKYSPMIAVQYAGFTLVIFGLLWAGRHELGWLRKLMHR